MNLLRSPPLRMVSWLALALGAFHALWFIGVTFRARFQLPAWDLWGFFVWWAERGSVWRAIYDQYEHHRMVVVGSLVHLDQVVFGGQYLSVYLVTLGATVGVCAWALCHLSGRIDDRMLFRFTAAAFLTGSFSLVGAEGYLHGFRAWIPLTLVVGALTMAAFAGAVTSRKPGTGRRYLALALGLAIVDNYTGAPGLLIWPALVVMALVMRAGWRTLVAVLVVGGLTAFTFLYGFVDFQQGRGGFANLLVPGRLFLTMVHFLGGPVSHSFFIDPFSRISLEFGMLAGTVALAAFIWIGVRALLRPPGDAVEVALLGYLVFAFGWLMATSIKHHPLPPAPFTPNFKSSDFMVAMTVWPALFASGALWLIRRPAPVLKAVFGLVVLGYALLFTPLQLQLLIDSERQNQEVRLAGLSYVSDVMENGYFTDGFFHSEVLGQVPAGITGFKRIPAARAILRRLAIPPLDHPAPRAVGQGVQEAFGHMVETPCDGEFRGRHGVVEGLRLWGRMNLVRLGGDVRLVIVDVHDRIVGVAERFNRFKMRMPLEMPDFPRGDGWLGYARVAGAEPLAAVAIDAGGRQVCRLAAV